MRVEHARARAVALAQHGQAGGARTGAGSGAWARWGARPREEARARGPGRERLGRARRERLFCSAWERRGERGTRERERREKEKRKKEEGKKEKKKRKKAKENGEKKRKMGNKKK